MSTELGEVLALSTKALSRSTRPEQSPPPITPTPRIAPLDGTEKPQQLVVRGRNFAPQWSPDGSKLAFVSVRTDHSFIAVSDSAAKTVQFLAPSVDFDGSFVWSLDGKRIAFVRQPTEKRRIPGPYGLVKLRRAPRMSSGTAARARKGHFRRWLRKPAGACSTGPLTINW